jgi:hypothetical protein
MVLYLHPQYAIMAWCLVKYRDITNFIYEAYHEKKLKEVNIFQLFPK